MRNVVIIAVTAIVVALPFLFRRAPTVSDWNPGDPTLVIVSPHNEAIRYEFARAFASWHQARYGRPVKIDWRNMGGTTEIMRYLAAEYTAAFRAWWRASGQPWPQDGGDAMAGRGFDPKQPPPGGTEPASDAYRQWEQRRDVYHAFRDTDDPSAFTCGIDLLFGGGAYDHGKAFQAGLTVLPWPTNAPPPDTLVSAGGIELIPRGVGGETWRTDVFFGNALSTFGICYNVDRLRDLNIARPPERWEDLTDAAYFRQIGVADPTKSGSIAKAFENIVHEQCQRAVQAAGFAPEAVDAFEESIRRARLPPGELPAGVPAVYQDAVEAGWIEGLRIVQRIGANARYFTDSASKVPIDVDMGNAAAGLVIDFYGRYQAEISRRPNRPPRMIYVTPVGGSSVSADPISLLRGAAHRTTAERFIAFVLSEDGQQLWNGRPGTPGGPERFALRRLPVRRDFYPSPDAEIQAAYERHRLHTVDSLGDPAVNAYELAAQFTYRPRWTAAHFNVQRDLIRCMCMDAGEELRAAWQTILEHGGPAAQPAAMAALERLPDRPEPLTWRAALGIPSRHDRLDYMREWTIFFRRSYTEARQLAQGGAGGGPARK